MLLVGLSRQVAVRGARRRPVTSLRATALPGLSPSSLLSSASLTSSSSSSSSSLSASASSASASDAGQRAPPRPPASESGPRAPGDTVARLLDWLDRRDDASGSILTNSSKSDDLQALVNHYTAPALARALRDREETLAECAALVCAEPVCADAEPASADAAPADEEPGEFNGTGKSKSESKSESKSKSSGIDEARLEQARELLGPFLTLPAPAYAGVAPGPQATPVDGIDAEERERERRQHAQQQQAQRKLRLPDSSKGGLLHPDVLRRLRKRLNRLPREISSRSRRRASVIVPLCLVSGEPSVLFTQRSHHVSSHKGEVCFPGGMIDEEDASVVDAGLRELQEEVGIAPANVNVLGVLRCDWSELANITGVAVTPVVGFLGPIEDLTFHPNPDEVRNYFTVPLRALLDQDAWSLRKYSPPVFRQTGAPEEQVIWGLTGYILHRFMRILPSVVFGNQMNAHSKRIGLRREYSMP